MKYQHLIDKKTGERIVSRPSDQVAGRRPWSKKEREQYEIVEQDLEPRAVADFDVEIRARRGSVSVKASEIDRRLVDSEQHEAAEAEGEAKALLAKRGYAVSKQKAR